MQLPAHSSSRPCGIVHVRPDQYDVHLPLERVEVHADVIDVSAIVTITQQFWQYSPAGLERAKYVFPVPVRAAVCAFKMTAADGMVITAVAKEKEEAKREHETAIAQGQMTGLVEHVADDVFSISLGALPGQQMISTEITYVLDLMDDDISDQVRLQVPMYVGMRYGAVPEGMQGALQAPPNRVSISVDVRMQGTVRNIISPTHPAVILSDGATAYASRCAQYSSLDFLQRDFVLSILADGLDAPRCFAQKAKNGVTAIQLNIVPKFNLPSVSQQEYIFLVDRSGSMNGDRIDTAKKTLVMLLRALPSQGTYINIFSFGSRCDSLWHRSGRYDERALGTATEYVDKMWADYGGTETLKALRQVFSSRRADTPTACFVLTDGESHDTNGIIKAVDHAVQKAQPNASLRVFTLGIGNTTSSAVCEGIARAGNGVCLMATTSESIIGKCSKLVRASRTYILKNVFVDWGVGKDFNKLRAVRQAPAPLSAIYPGNRVIVFALIEDEKSTPPKEVVIRAQRDGQGEVLQFRIPVQTVEFPPDHPHPQLIPTLAARRAIMDLDDKSRTQCPPDLRATIIKLGTEYQLASKFTSFVAVDRRTEEQIKVQIREKVKTDKMEALRLPSYVQAYDPTIEDDSDDGEWEAAMPRGLEYNLEARGPQRAVVSLPRSRPAIGTPIPPPGARPAVAAPLLFPTEFILADEPVIPPVGATPSVLPTGTARPAKRNSVNLGSSLRNAFSGISLRRSSDASNPPSPQRRSGGILGSLRGGSSSQPAPASATTDHVKRRRRMDSSSTSYSLPQATAPPMTSLGVPGFESQPVSEPIFQQEEYGAPRRAVFQEEFGVSRSAMYVPVPAVPQTAEDKVVALVRLQSFDGSFPPTAQLEATVGKNLLLEAEKLKVDQRAWATILAVAYLKKYMKDQPELLDGLVEKAMEFLSRVQNDDLQTLLARADSLVV